MIHSSASLVFHYAQSNTQAFSSFETTRVHIDVFVLAKAKRLEAWTCEAYAKREKLLCTQSECKHRRHERTKQHQNTMERSLTFYPAECYQAVRNRIIGH